LQATPEAGQAPQISSEEEARPAEPAGVGTPSAPEEQAATPPDDQGLPTTPSEGTLTPPAGAAASRAEPERPTPVGPAPLRFGVLAGRDAVATRAALAPVAHGLSQAVGRPVELLPMVSYAAMADVQMQRRIDGGFYSAAAFAATEAECRCLEPLVAPAAFDGATAYHAIIVARRGSGIRSVADLAGKTIAAGADDSLGARRMQLASLAAEGADPSGLFGALRDAGSAEEAVRQVAAGEADAAFAWSSLAGDMASGYSRGTLADLVAHGEVTMDDLEVIWRSPPITHGPFAVLASLSEEEKRRLEAYLMQLEASQPAAYDALDPFYGGGFVPVEPDDYAGLQALTVREAAAAGPQPGASGEPSD
jgi:phosphonate transport system substrate-binding protein